MLYISVGRDKEKILPGNISHFEMSLKSIFPIVFPLTFQLTFTFSKSTIETLEKGVKYAQS